MTTKLGTTIATTTAVATFLVLTACGSPVGPGAATAAPVAAPVAAIQEPAACKDGQPPYASIDPGNITDSSNAGRMGEIRRSRVLKVGVSGDAKLWGASNPENGDLDGFDVDVARKVAEALEVKVEFVVLPLSGRLPALKADRDEGGVDLVAERLSMTCERWQGLKTDPSTFINMSSQYYSAGQRVLIRSDAGSGVNSIQKLPAGTDICAVAGSTSLTNLQNLKLDLNVVVASDSGQCLVKFQEGEAAAITADDTTLAGFADQDPNARVVGDAFTREYYGLGTSAGAPEFTRYVNVVLEGLRSDGTLRRLYARYMADNVDAAEPAVPAAVYGRNIAGLARAS